MTQIVYNTNQALANGPVAGVGGGAAEVTKYVEFTVPAAGFVTNGDYVNMFHIPKGAVFTYFALTVADLDGSTGLTLSLGDSNTAARFLSASTIGQAGGASNTPVAGSLNYKYAADDMIRVTATAAATTPQGGLIQLTFKYVMSDQVPSG